MRFEAGGVAPDAAHGDAAIVDVVHRGGLVQMAELTVAPHVPAELGDDGAGDERMDGDLAVVVDAAGIAEHGTPGAAERDRRAALPDDGIVEARIDDVPDDVAGVVHRIGDPPERSCRQAERRHLPVDPPYRYGPGAALECSDDDAVV